MTRPLLMNRIDREASPREGPGITLPGSAERHISAGEIATPGQFLLQVFLHRRRTVVVAAAACVGLALIYLLCATSVYTISSRLYVAHSPNLTPDDRATASERPYLNTQCKVLRSTPILAIALGQPGVNEMAMFEDVDNRIEYLKEELTTYVGDNDEVVTIELESAEPEEGARFLSMIVDAYLAYQSSQKQSTAAQLLTALQKQRGDHLLELDKKREEMVRFKRENGTLSFEDENGSIVMRSLSSLSDALINARLVTLSAKAAYEEAARALPKEIEEKGEQPAAIALDEKTEADLRLSLSAWEQRLQELRQQYGPSHPQLRAAESRVHHLRVAYVAALQRRWKVATQMEADLQQSFEQQRKMALDLAGKAAEFARLEAEVRRLEKMTDILDGHINDLNLAEEAQAAMLRVLEPAAASLKPTSPRKTRTLAIAMLLGVMLGTGLGTLQELLEPRLRTPDQISATLGLQVLGAVGPMTPEQTPAMHAQTMLLDPRSDAADAFRTICTAVVHAPSPDGSKTLLVTSPASDEGKTTVATNLALALAMTRERVLLVDADTRRPVLHDIFEQANETGLTSVLQGQKPWQDAIRHTSEKNLDLLPCGPLPENPAELLNSHVLAELMSELAKNYDRVIIDAPPVMGAPDARILGACCNLTVLVLRADRLKRQPIEQTIDDLVSVGSKILGVVVNVTRPDADYHSSPRDRYYKAAYRNGDSANGHSASNGNGNGHTDENAVSDRLLT